MAIKEIPAKTVFVCDCCYREVESSKARTPSDWGRFEFHEIGRDFQGHAVGGIARNFIMCQDCCVRIHKYIRTISSPSR